MGKDKTAALACAKKATVKAKGKQTSRGGSSSRSGLPAGWIQGDWIRSAITQDNLDDLVEEGIDQPQVGSAPGGRNRAAA